MTHHSQAIRTLDPLVKILHLDQLVPKAGGRTKRYRVVVTFEVEPEVDMSKKCTNCGHTGLNSMDPTLYHYRASGLDNIYLKGGVIEYVCPKCGERSTSIKNLVGLHAAIANSLATAKRRLAGKELRFLREQLAFSAEEFAQLVEYSEDHIRKIESGSMAPKAPYEMFLRVAILREMQAPECDLRELVERKEYKLEELKFAIRDRRWEFTEAA